MAREKWDEADTHMDGDEDDDMESQSPVTPRSIVRSILPDWTRTPLPVGAPPAKAPPVPAPEPAVDMIVSSAVAAA